MSGPFMGPLLLFKKTADRLFTASRRQSDAHIESTLAVPGKLFRPHLSFMLCIEHGSFILGIIVKLIGIKAAKVLRIPKYPHECHFMAFEMFNVTPFLHHLLCDIHCIDKPRRYLFDKE